MREILFRGKRLDNGEWAEGACIKDFEFYGRKDEHLYIVTHKHPSGCFGADIYFEVFPETIGQYTSITDKNGKKIFEGDIFRIGDEMVGDIIFKDGCFRMEVYGLCGTYTESGYDECGGGWGIIECEPIDWYYIHDMEIIGNIHDNPELLKGD